MRSTPFKLDFKPLRFIGESVEVQYDKDPTVEKKPGCPDRFVWDGELHHIDELLAEWHDYGRQGRMAHNMRPTHLSTASRRGSWGVGRDHYRVRTSGGRFFELYYDRAPTGAGKGKGVWLLFAELEVGS